MNTAEYFSMQGRVYIGKRNADGSRAPARWVFDASTLEVQPSEDSEDKNESWSGQRGVAATMRTALALAISLTLVQLNTDNAALALAGERVEVTSGSVVAEEIGDVTAGSVWALDYAAIADLELEDGTTPSPVALVEDVDYTVDTDLGIITFLTTRTGVKGDYDYAAHSLVTALTSLAQDYYVLFAGLNTVKGSTGKCRGELYYVNLSPTEAFGLIQASFGELALTGKAKMDPFRQADPKWGGYGRLHLIDTATGG